MFVFFALQNGTQIVQEYTPSNMDNINAGCVFRIRTLLSYPIAKSNAKLMNHDQFLVTLIHAKRGKLTLLLKE